MVIECIGLPGSGKSYLMKQLEDELAVQGRTCVNVSDRCMNRFAWKAAKRALHAGIFLSGSARRARADAEEALRAEKDARSKYGIYEDERFTLESIAVFRMVYRRMMNSDSIYLFDEGLVHSLVKYCADMALSDDTFMKMSKAAEKDLAGDRFVVYNIISENRCFASLRERDRHICAFDELPEEELRGILREYTRLNELYSSGHEVIRIYREEENGAKMERLVRAIGK